MTPADQHALREALARHFDGAAFQPAHSADQYWGQRRRDAYRRADAIIAGPLAPYLAAEAENTRLKETVEAARAALKPFAEEADWYDPSDDDGDHIYIAGNMRIGDLRAARSVLATIPPKENPDA